MRELDELSGPYGTARHIPDTYSTNPATVCGWIITAPCWHPVWSQYRLGIVSLADFPDLPPAKLHRPGVTHELSVVALNPEHGPYDARSLPADGVHYLTPVNIAEQITATDEQAAQLALRCVRAVVDGLLCPETADAPDRIRAQWRDSIRQAIEHMNDTRRGRIN
ncbi:hypothetical protein ACIP96_06445 [Streptomyces nigra]|uniref:hypothetical protein n=1 Tax=Streptomyces nigra TaxID=1827580 RepID=UPI003821E181